MGDVYLDLGVRELLYLIQALKNLCDKLRSLHAPIQYIQQYVMPYLQMLETIHNSTIFLFVSSNLDLKLESIKNAIWI